MTIQFSSASIRGKRRIQDDALARYVDVSRKGHADETSAAEASIMEATAREKIATVDACFRFLICPGVGTHDWKRSAPIVGRVGSLLDRLLREPLPFEHDDLHAIVMAATTLQDDFDPRSVLDAVQRYLDGSPPSSRLSVALERLRASVDHQTRSIEVQHIDAILSGGWAPSEALDAADAWSAAMVEILASAGDQRPAWNGLLDHCAAATQTKPSKRWLKQATELVEAIGTEHHAKALGIVLDAVGTPSPVAVDLPAHEWHPTNPKTTGDPTLVSHRFTDMLRGLVWSVLANTNRIDDLIPRVGDTAERCFAKLPYHGPLAPKIGNGCLTVLSTADSLAAVGQLARLESRATHASTRKQIAKAHRAAAAGLTMTPVDLEELGAPTCGLTAVGSHREMLGDVTAELRVEGANRATLAWHTPAGTTRKTVPKAVRDGHAEALMRIKKQVSELKKLMPAQRDRVERLLRNGRRIPFADWRARYLDHVLVGTLARRLIWQVGDDDMRLIAWSGATLEDAAGRLVDVDDQPVSVDAQAPVRLWHPVSSDAATVAAWRDWIIRHEATQPFKQAHRENYMLTDAERETGTYTNRFAGHILKQHQLQALCRTRGWNYTLQGFSDASRNTPRIALPDEGFSVRFDVAPIDEREVSDGNVFLYVATDRVEFSRSDEGTVPLTEIPPLLFSEMMRDIDLFVGVSSIGNDPNWVDGGPRGLHGPYWNAYAFGELGVHAETRRAVLETLLPKLKIADRCTIDGRFLEVRGRLRTYRIHIGSANIQMSPNNQYLCIVAKPSSRAAGTVTLPFEGDSKLSLILSKAFMLADDHKIKDSTIVNQIRNP